jgi:hypothetical protein
VVCASNVGHSQKACSQIAAASLKKHSNTAAWPVAATQVAAKAYWQF